MDVESIFQNQKHFFSKNITRDVSFRTAALHKLEKSIRAHQEDILSALHKDLKKPELEAIQGEIIPCINEIHHAIKHAEKWSKTKRARGPLFFPFSKGWVEQIPHGVTAIFSPFNHPISTSFTPLVSAIAAGNCVLLKPSELTPHTAEIIDKIIKDAFEPGHVSVINGDSMVAQSVLGLDLDYIFFTGSTNVGKIVMRSAAERLTPLTLELGGKCPGIIHKDANIKSAAARVAWGKFWNAGQSCNTVDHLFVHDCIKDEFVKELIACIKKYYTDDPKKSGDYGRIINQRHVDRIAAFLSDGQIIHGGEVDRDDLYIAPTVMDNIHHDAPISFSEIFGPILPLYRFHNIDTVISDINRQPKPLAVYVFARDQRIANTVIKNTDSGTACINDVMIQSTSTALPIGGVGQSGFGRMHGHEGFLAFSHSKSVLKQSYFELPGRFPPQSNFMRHFIKKLY